jgi:hypothetical protein
MSVHQIYSGDHLEEWPTQKPTVVSDVRERQGVTGHNVRYVLLLGTLGAVVALTAVLVASFFY